MWCDLGTVVGCSDGKMSSTIGLWVQKVNLTSTKSHKINAVKTF